MAGKSDDIGKEWEAVFQRALSMCSGRGLAFDRLSDTTSARGSFMQSTPSDYIITLPFRAGQKMAFVECKSSTKDTEFKRTMLSSKQKQTALHCALAGMPYWVWFWSEPGGELQVWDGVAAVDTRERAVSKDWMLHRVKAGCSVHDKGLDELVYESLVEVYDLKQKAFFARKLSKLLGELQP